MDILLTGIKAQVLLDNGAHFCAHSYEFYARYFAGTGIPILRDDSQPIAVDGRQLQRRGKVSLTVQIGDEVL